MRLDSVRLAALGTDTALLQYLPALARHESPFLAQMAEVRGFIEQHAEPSPSAPDDAHLEVLLCQCDEYVDTLRRRSREAGVGVNLVFLLARIEQILARLRELRALLVPQSPGAAGEAHSRESSSSCAWCARRIAATACATCSAAPSNCSRGASRSRRAARASTTSPSPAANTSRCTAPRPGPADHRRDGAGQDPDRKTRPAPGLGGGRVQPQLRHRLRADPRAAFDHRHQATGDDGDDARGRARRPRQSRGAARRAGRSRGRGEPHAVDLDRRQRDDLPARGVRDRDDGGPVPRLGPGGAGQGGAPAARPASVAQPRAAARGDRRRLSFPERAHLGLLRQSSRCTTACPSACAA